MVWATDGNDSAIPAAKATKCRACGNLETRHVKVRMDTFCLPCALGKFKRKELISGSAGMQAAWSAVEVYELYHQLYRMLGETAKAELPAKIPLPLESFVCMGRDKPERPGYPSRGHIIGQGALVAEGGCPSGHVLCKNCANSGFTCSICEAFVSYQDLATHQDARGESGHRNSQRRRKNGLVSIRRLRRKPR